MKKKKTTTTTTTLTAYIYFIYFTFQLSIYLPTLDINKNKSCSKLLIALMSSVVLLF